MKKKEIIESMGFDEWLLKSAEDTIVNCTQDELADFAFGSGGINQAIESYCESKGIDWVDYEEIKYIEWLSEQTEPDILKLLGMTSKDLLVDVLEHRIDPRKQSISDSLKFYYDKELRVIHKDLETY